MVHICVKCGKVYPDSSAEILIGCSQCGGKKFYFERPGATKGKTSAAEHTPAPAAPSPAPAREEPDDEERRSRVESIRIVAPGTYELNIEKMAQSDDRVVSLGREGSYAVDLLSMSGAKKKRKADR
jgi:uncharacterized protein